MAKTVKGMYKCEKDGCSFEWQHYYFKKNQTGIVFGKWDELGKNCVNLEKKDGKYIAQVKCPSCLRTYITTYMFINH